MDLNYEEAKAELERSYTAMEQLLADPDSSPSALDDITQAADSIFTSQTQAIREVLLGCILARLQNAEINIRQIYIKHGDKAFNGRTLDERVVNPFFNAKRIPCSKAPYLSTFRRGVQLTEHTAVGIRDQAAYAAMLKIVSYAEKKDKRTCRALLDYLMFRFLKLRESSFFAVTQLQRMSLNQYEILIDKLLRSKSGGRFPVLLSVATFYALKDHFNLNWTIEFQGINVADSSKGAGGDITIEQGNAVLLSAEVTERPVDKNRVVATFTTKIAPYGIEEYLFLVRQKPEDRAAITQAYQYFAQGHEVNFVEIYPWILMILATIGRNGRTKFNKKMIELLEHKDVPAHIKAIWNDEIDRLTTV